MRGGYCFEQNKLLAAVLAHLGYHCNPVRSRVVLLYDWSVTATACTHIVLLVALPDKPEISYLVDVGFGASAPLAPMALEGLF